MSEQGIVHFGPVWPSSWKEFRKTGASLSACRQKEPTMMTNHKPWVSCAECQTLMTGRLSGGNPESRSET